jgi:hypothetical protein
MRVLDRFAICALLVAGCAHQQLADEDYHPEVVDPEFAPGAGSTVLIDEAHHNFHTAAGRYRAFVELLERDGYIVRTSTAPLSAETLAGIDVLVIANALHESDIEQWTLPNPSAFTADEIAAVRAWVEGGGALLLIADHMPFPGAAHDLGAAFGFEFQNGFAVHPERKGPAPFDRADGTLTAHPISDGRSADERVERVLSFTGQAFRSPPAAAPLLVLPEGFVSLEPETAWEFDAQTPRIDVGGFHQGATLIVGQGRVAVFGEAAMFTAQVGGPDGATMGMNAPGAEQNSQFALNLLHWLSGLLD